MHTSCLRFLRFCMFWKLFLQKFHLRNYVSCWLKALPAHASTGSLLYIPADEQIFLIGWPLLTFYHGVIHLSPHYLCILSRKPTSRYITIRVPVILRLYIMSKLLLILRIPPHHTHDKKRYCAPISCWNVLRRNSGSQSHRPFQLKHTTTIHLTIIQTDAQRYPTSYADDLH